MRVVDLIERFVRYPETLSQDQRKMIECVLKTRPTASALELYYREFYKEVDRLSSRIDPSLKTFLDSVAPSDSDVGPWTTTARLDRETDGGMDSQPDVSGRHGGPIS